MPIIKEDALRKYNPDGFDFKEMKTEVSQAMQFDYHRDKVDDTKKKAIHDSRNYDDFKARVAGCHLKPIHRKEFNAPPKFAFNRQSESAASTAGISSSAGVSQEALSGLRAERGAPKSGREFERELRRCSSAEQKVAFLKLVDEDSYAKLFGRELDAEVLRKLLIAIDEASGTSVAPPGTTKRFLVPLATHCPASTTQASSFFIPVERNIVARLLAMDQNAGEITQDEIVMVCAALGVPPSSVATAAAELGGTTKEERQIDGSAVSTREAQPNERDFGASSGGCDSSSANGVSAPAFESGANTDSAQAAGGVELMD